MKAPRFWRIGRVWWCKKVSLRRLGDYQLASLKSYFDAAMNVATPLSVGCMLAMALAAYLSFVPVSHGQRLDPEVAAKQKMRAVCWSDDEVVVTLSTSNSNKKTPYLISPSSLAASPADSQLMMTNKGQFIWLISRADQERLGLQLAPASAALLSPLQWSDQNYGHRRTVILGMASGIAIFLFVSIFVSCICEGHMEWRKQKRGRLRLHAAY